MPLEKLSRNRGLKIACCGFFLVLIAIAVSNQIPIATSSNKRTLNVRATEAAFLIPSIVGSLMMFAGIVRMGVTARPRFVVFGGLSLFLAANLLPLVSASFLAVFATTHSAVPFLLPLFVLRLLGLILFSIGVLRFLGAQGKEI